MAEIYFTWPDGAVGYDCSGCGACCKGHGIGVDAAGGQLVELVGRYPELAPYARRRGNAWTLFNPRDRCWFLADDGLCRVEVDHGRDAKPAACRLFPFNRIFRIGDVTVVDYNSVICPLARVADGARHGDIAADIAAVTDGALVGTALPGDGAAFLAGEKPIADACFTGDWQTAWTAMSDTDAPDLTEPLASLAGRPLPMATGETLANALVLTPSMRFNELYGPRNYADTDGALPGMWLAWLHFAGAGAALADRDLSMQELTTTWGELAPLTYLASRWHQRPHFPPGPVELPGAADPDGVVRAFGEGCAANRNYKRTAGDLWRAAAGDRPAAEAAALLKLADPLIRKLRWRRAGGAAAAGG